MLHSLQTEIGLVICSFKRDMMFQDMWVKIETMTKNRGYVILGIFVIAAILTPPDALSQTAMALPMWLLYEVGIVMSRILLREKLAQQRREEQSASS